MARPIKEGLDYCSLDTDIFSDRKIRRLLKTFGAKGFTIFMVVLCEVYKDKGYYMEWDGELAFDISDNIPGVSEQLVKEVINFCIECGLFDKSVFSSKSTLTSHGIQKRYKKAKEGGKVVIVPEIWVIDQITNVIPEKPPVNPAISTQSKVKESKVNNTPLPPKGDSTPASQDDAPTGDKNIISEKSRKSSTPTGDVIYPSPAFESLWQQWIDHRINAIRKPYKTVKAQQNGLNYLIKLAAGNIDIAKSIVEKSVGNGYQGFFAPSTSPPGNSESTASHKPKIVV